ncbi:hypothetical protein [Mycobacterium avium]|uniref:Uncharacterized protein n=1 Tax=Mycobacterium avium subsp. hominissuis TaxID=439334 RepID=A0AAI8SQD3_MYCAV|nr:hypothetical protein [Mycobacterium avium]PBA08567.1 hypothetical protein CKJ70_25750 [Mycobacterium avium]BBN50768.1 hypothetical protein JPH1_52430 [Mycobacterium avium subsp. hominissuis]
MSGSHYEWATVEHLNYLMVDREHAPDELGTAAADDTDMWARKVTQPWALFLGNEDGLIIEGDLDAIVDRLDDIARYVRRVRDEQRR